MMHNSDLRQIVINVLIFANRVGSGILDLAKGWQERDFRVLTNRHTGGVVDIGPYLREIRDLGIDCSIRIERKYSPEPHRHGLMQVAGIRRV